MAQEAPLSKSTLSDICIRNSIEPFENTAKGIVRALEGGILQMAPLTYQGAVDAIQRYGRVKQTLVVLPEPFAVSREEADRRIKSLGALAKMDSAAVISAFYQGTTPPERLSKRFLEERHIKPQDLITQAMQQARMTPDAPPAGIYWRNSFGEMSAFTWTRTIAAAERMVNDPQTASILDRTFYAHTARVKVTSRSAEGKAYEFPISGLPLGEAGDKQPFSGWLNIKHRSSDPDASYRGVEHSNYVTEVIFWSTPAIQGVFKAMEFASHQLQGKRFRANPFPLPRPELYHYAQCVKYKTLQLRWLEGKPFLCPLNMTEQDALIGHKTMNESYARNWFHGKGDLQHLRESRR